MKFRLSGLPLLSIILLASVLSLRGENLVSIRTEELPPLSDVTIFRILTLEGQLVALGRDSCFVFDPSLRAWKSREWRLAGQVEASVNNGAEAFLLIAENPDGAVSRVDRVALESGILAVRPLPPLPAPVRGARGAIMRERLYIAGVLGDGTPHLYAMDLTAVAPTWATRTGWPASAGLIPAVTSLVGQGDALFLTSGAELPQSGRLWRWTEKEGWLDKGDLPGRTVEGTARAIGQAHLLYLLRMGPAEDEPPRLLTFQTITGSWATLADPQAIGAHVGTPWRNGIAWERPAGSGSQFGFAEIESGRVFLRWLDWIVISLYLGAMLGIGFYFYLKDKRHSTSDFFVGGRTIPFWAAGVSLYATNTSSISYIAIPAKSFETNWQYLTNNLVAILGLAFVAIFIVPLLRRLNLMSIFEYLETRFHPIIRTLASALYMAVQIGSRMSVILFLPSLAIATMTGIHVVWSILIMGGFTIIYTALGGMKAVIWTDFVQLIVKMGGIAFAIVFIVSKLNGGFGELLTIAAVEEKMKLFDWSWDLTKATVWGFLFLVLFDVVLTFPKDQVLMQRVLSTKSDRDASRSVWTFAALMLPGGFMFYFVGTALFAFYKTHPERMDPLLSIDATFPLFIAAELPMGIRGLIIAGILAAAMATLSSIMNSVATLASVDFYEKLVKNPDPKVSVHFAEAMTVVTGLLGMAVAIILSRYDIHSLFDVSIELAGVLGGGFAGAYTLGMFTRRANWQGVAIGVAVSIVLTTISWRMKLVHPYFYLAISICLCIVFGYLASWFFPAPQSLEGLTIARSPRGSNPSASGK